MNRLLFMNCSILTQRKKKSWAIIITIASENHFNSVLFLVICSHTIKILGRYDLYGARNIFSECWNQKGIIRTNKIRKIQKSGISQIRDAQNSENQEFDLKISLKNTEKTKFGKNACRFWVFFYCIDLFSRVECSTA